MTSSIRNEKGSVLGSLLKLLPGKGITTATDDGPRDREAIQSWLVAKVAGALDVPTEQIDIREPFASFGLDSRTAVSLSGELERWLGRRLSATLIWDYPTIESVANYLTEGAEQQNAAQESDQRVAVPDDPSEY